MTAVWTWLAPTGSRRAGVGVRFITIEGKEDGRRATIRAAAILASRQRTTKLTICDHTPTVFLVCAWKRK
jgi:hypothetical protein